MPYKAFISYSHAADAKLAPALESALHRFAKPWYRLRALHVFRDKTSLALTPALWPTIEKALSESEYFILLASPDAAGSAWVQREVNWWLEHRSADMLLVVLTDGDMQWNTSSRRFEMSERSALPHSLHAAFRDEPLWLDLRWAKTEEHLALANPRFRQALAEIAAPLHGRPKDDLVGDDVREHRRTKRLAWSAVVSLVVLTVFSIVFAVAAEMRRRDAARQRQEAERQADIARNQTQVAEKQARIAHREAQIALARRLVAQSELARTSSATDRQLSALLALEAMRRFQTLGLPSFEADLAARRSFSLLPQSVAVWQTGRAVDAVAFSADGGRVVAASRRLGTSTWDSRNYGRVSETTSASARAYALALSPGGKFLAAGTDDGEAYVVDVGTLERLTPRIALGEDQHVRAVAVSSDGAYLAIAGRDNPSAPLVVRHLPTGTEVGRVGWSTAVAFSPTGRFLAAGGGLWEVSDADGKRTLRSTKVATKESFGVEGVSFSPDEAYFTRAISQLGKRSIELWSLPEQRLLGELSYDVPGGTIAVSPGGRYVAVASRGASPSGYIVEVLEPAAGNATRVHVGSLPGALAFSPTEPTLAIGEAAGALTLWQITSLTEIARFRPLGDVKGAAFSQDAGRLTTLSWAWSDRTGTQMVKNVWDVRRGRELVIGRQTFRPYSHAFSADGAFLAVSGRGEVMVWELATVRERRPIPFSGLVARQLALSADGRYLAVLTQDRLRVWEIETSKEVASLACPPGPAEFVFEGTRPQIALGSDGWYLATAFRRRIGRDGALEKFLTFLRVWDVKASKEIFTAPLSEPVRDKEPAQCSLSQDGRYLAIGVDDGTVSVHELTRGHDVTSRFDHELVGFSPDGRYLATRSIDIDSPPFRTSPTLEGRRYFGTGAEGITHIWDVTSRQEVARIRHERGSRPLSFSPRGDFLAVLGQDGTIRVLALSPEALVTAACAGLSRNLTADEWKRFIGDEPYKGTCSK